MSRYYSFPPSCVGEVGRLGAQSRREIGHGTLDERALEPILPSEEEFPYTIRVKNTITESNGSSSMASVYEGCLALQDDRVPLKSQITGIAMALVVDTEEFWGDGTPLILSDITGSEDASGDMDFKEEILLHVENNMWNDVCVISQMQQTLKMPLGRSMDIHSVSKTLEGEEEEIVVNQYRHLSCKGRHSTHPSNTSGPSTPPTYSSGPLTPTNYYLGSLERITKKRTKNKAKTTKPRHNGKAVKDKAKAKPKTRKVKVKNDLLKSLPLRPNSRGRRVIPFDYFINNDLAYLSGGVSSRTYATSVTKTKAADFGHIKWIEDLVPNTMWSQVPIVYDKHALWGISHCGRKRRQFYGYVVHRESTHDVSSRKRIIAIKQLKIVKWNNYKHLDWITVRKLTNLNIEEYLALGVSLRMFTRSIVIKRRVEDLQLGNKDKKNRLMRIDELHKFSNGTLNDVWSAFNDILKRIRMEYLPQTFWRNVDRERAGAMIQAIDQQLRNRRIMRSLEKFIGGRSYVGDLQLLERTI
ncbi:hypothetical protein Tco_0348688 [Tanacetum coccineum]